MMTSLQIGSRRNLIIGGLLVVVLLVLVVESVTLLPRALQVWQPYDLRMYIEMGTIARTGINPIGPLHYYPLPTVLWIFVPLSLMPDWFRFVWAIVPFAFILILHRTNGLAFLLFPPFWFNITDAMIDSWLLLPMKWLAENRPRLAGIGAVILLTKPQIALLPVAFMFLRWLITRDWKNLSAFVIGLIAFCLPAFIFDPLWIVHMLQVIPQRANESMVLLPLLTSSLWAWWWLGGIASIMFVALAVAAIALAVRAFRRRGDTVAILQSCNQLMIPILFAANLTLLVPFLRTRREILIIVMIGLAAFALDAALGGFGGGYAFIALAVLVLQQRGNHADHTR
ncbi:hypothetical protein ANRL3_01900 [Anaerolineae bacterium]|nr:hypothetical protein ANRL3_01900 [Anaerolineae bacterium]